MCPYMCMSTLSLSEWYLITYICFQLAHIYPACWACENFQIGLAKLKYYYYLEQTLVPFPVIKPYLVNLLRAYHRQWPLQFGWNFIQNAPHHWPIWEGFHSHENFEKVTVNSLWPSDATWWQRSGSTLAQVMACCLTAPSHYLNQCWLIISEAQWHS